jgi:hypothetical protein
MIKKTLLIVFLLTCLQTVFFADQDYLLGSVESRMGKANVVYVKAKRTHIRIEIDGTKLFAKIYLPREVREFKKHAAKFIEWHGIAVEHNSVLNKKIGELSSFKMEFITFHKKYEISFDYLSGMRLMTFDLDNLKQILHLISDENIDKIINEEKRRQEKEDALFQ